MSQGHDVAFEPSGPPRVRLFGSILVLDGARRLGARDFGGVKPRQVLEILLASRGHPVPKDRLAEHLWGQALPHDPLGALETYVSVLRRHLEPQRGRGATLVVTEHGAYRFAVEQAEVDLDRFDELVEWAARADTHQARAYLEEALALARGEVLEDEPYAAWAERLREQYRQRVLQALLDASEAALAERDCRAALGHAQRALAIDALNERAYRLVMLACYGLGRQHEAISAFQQCRTRLQQELGVDPLEETEGLYVAILRHEDPRSLLPRRITRSDPGFRRLIEQWSAAVCWTTDPDLRFTAVSGAGLTSLDLTPEQLIGRTLFDVFGTTDPDVAPITGHRRALEGEPVTYQVAWGGRTYQHHLEPLRDTAGQPAGVVGVWLDITERDQAEQALREAERRYRDLYQEAPAAYLSVDVDGRVVMANRQALELVGYALEDLVGRPVLDLYADTPEGRPKGREVFARFRAGEEVDAEELEWRRADGRPLWVRVWVRPILDAAGRVVQSRSIVEDITLRRRAAQALWAAERRYRELYEEAPAAYFSVDADGRLLTANRRAGELLGYAQEVLVGRHVFALHVDTPEEQATARTILARLLAGEELRGEAVTLRRADGGALWARLWVRPSFDQSGRVTGGRAILQEVARAASVAPRASEGRFRSIFERLAEAIFVIDPFRDEILDANPRACALLEYSREELLATPVSAVHPHEMPKLLAWARSVHQQGQGWTDELTCTTRDGMALPTQISASAIQLADRSCLLALARPIARGRQVDPGLRRRLEILEAPGSQPT